MSAAVAASRPARKGPAPGKGWRGGVGAPAGHARADPAESDDERQPRQRPGEQGVVHVPVHDGRGQRHHRPEYEDRAVAPDRRGPAPFLDGITRLPGEVRAAMPDEGDERKDPDENRVPVEDADLATR